MNTSNRHKKKDNTIYTFPTELIKDDNCKEIVRGYFEINKDNSIEGHGRFNIECVEAAVKMRK